jgi:hypothetical protein
LLRAGLCAGNARNRNIGCEDSGVMTFYRSVEPVESLVYLRAKLGHIRAKVCHFALEVPAHVFDELCD